MSVTPHGIQNYINLFNAEVSSKGQPFLRVFFDENINILINTPVIVIFSLFAAILINKNFKNQRIQVIKASTDRKVLERLKEKCFEEYKLLLTKAEQKFLDDIAISSYCHRNS
jgi:hypothetical protein